MRKIISLSSVLALLLITFHAAFADEFTVQKTKNTSEGSATITVSANKESPDSVSLSRQVEATGNNGGTYTSMASTTDNNGTISHDAASELTKDGNPVSSKESAITIHAR